MRKDMEDVQDKLDFIAQELDARNDRIKELEIEIAARKGERHIFSPRPDNFRHCRLCDKYLANNIHYRVGEAR